LKTGNFYVHEMISKKSSRPRSGFSYRSKVLPVPQAGKLSPRFFLGVSRFL